MSQGKYIKLISHIKIDSENATETAKKITSGLDAFIKSVYGINADNSAWQYYSHNTERGFDKITATFYEVISGVPEESLHELLSEISTLNNGSFGLLLVDTDYGVKMYQCYGAAKFAEVEDVSGYMWSTDDYLCMETTVSEEQLAEILDCDANDVCDEAEDRANELAEALLPDVFGEIFDPDDELFESAEAEDDGENIRVKLMFSTHDHTTEQILALREAFASGELTDWALHLSESIEEGGIYKNIMICPEQNAVVEFETIAGRFANVKWLRLSI